MRKSYQHKPRHNNIPCKTACCIYRDKATSGERHSIEPKDSTFLKIVLATLSLNPLSRKTKQKREKNNPSILKHDFCSRTDPCYETGQTKQVEFFQLWNQHATCCTSPQCLVAQIHVQRPTLVVATNQMLTLRVESSIISIDSNITDNISVGSRV